MPIVFQNERVEVCKAGAVPTGRKIEPFGEKPAGQLIFMDDSHMSSIIMRPDLPAEWQSTGDRITTTLITYFGSMSWKAKRLRSRQKVLLASIGGEKL
jgi:Lipocalin-like domain